MGRGGEGVVEAAVSTVMRVYEEYRVDEVIVAHRSSPLKDKVVRVLEEALGDKVSVEARDLERLGEIDCSSDTGAGKLERRLRKLVEERCEGREVVVAVSPGSRRMAASLAIAGLGSPGSGPPECAAEVVHVDFYWGPWNGLFYPYTPRPLQPVLSLFPVLSLGDDTVNAARLYPDLTRRQCILPGGKRLPPLRCLVAEVSRRINAVADNPVFRSRGVDGAETRCECGKVGVEVDLFGKRVVGGPVEYCRHMEVKELLASLVEKLLDAAEKSPYSSLIQELVVFAGAIPLTARIIGGKREAAEKPLEKVLEGHDRVIVDTNLVYHGLHNQVNRFGRGRFILPYCVVAEIYSRYGESVKRYPDRGCNARCYMDIYAYLALKEILESGVSIVSTPPTPTCEASILQLDPFIVSRSLLVTGDWGAYQLWRDHPIAGITTIAYTYYDLGNPVKPSLRESEAYYSLLQLLVLLRSIHGVRVKLRVNDRVVEIPKLRAR